MITVSRPKGLKCPRCGATKEHMVSHGMSWDCRICGRSFTKVNCPKAGPKEGRPNCPHCGENYIISNGRSWWCKNCSRQFVKTPLPPHRFINPQNYKILSR